MSERKAQEGQIRPLNEELEERFRQRKAELETANRELEAYSYSVSHDLRAPLRAIDGFARILQEDHAPSLDAEGHRVIEVVRQNAERMGRLIDDLLAFSRVGRQALRQGKVDIGALVRGDAALLTQVWTNLIGNAVKFTSGKPRRVIDVGCRVVPG